MNKMVPTDLLKLITLFEQYQATDKAAGILKKIATTQRYLVCTKARDTLFALLAARKAKAQELAAKAA